MSLPVVPLPLPFRSSPLHNDVEVRPLPSRWHLCPRYWRQGWRNEFPHSATVATTTACNVVVVESSVKMKKREENLKSLSVKKRSDWDFKVDSKRHRSQAWQFIFNMHNPLRIFKTARVVRFDQVILGHIHEWSNSKIDSVIPLGPGWTRPSGRTKPDFTNISFIIFIPTRTKNLIE